MISYHTSIFCNALCLQHRIVSLEKVKSVPGEKYKAAARTVHNNTFNSPIVCGDTAGDSVVTSLQQAVCELLYSSYRHE